MKEGEEEQSRGEKGGREQSHKAKRSRGRRGNQKNRVETGKVGDSGRAESRNHGWVGVTVVDASRTRT